MTTPRGSPELAASQAVPETTVNEQIRRTEAGAGRYPVADRVTAPPGSCADGANYIVIATATGAFTGKEGQIATAVGLNAASGWLYRVLGTIDEGVLAYVQDEDAEYKWSGSAWGAVATGYTDEQAQDAIGAMVDGTLTYTDATPLLGINTASEAERIRDVIGAALVAGTNVTITVNDGADTITIDATGGGGGSSITAKDEGSTLTAGMTSIDFVGSGVVASNTGGAVTVTISGGGGGGGLTTPFNPQGRLTLTGATPVMTADATAQTSVYYTPYIGDQIPLYSGSAWSSNTFAQLTMALDTTNQTSGNLYDLFVWSDSGTIKIGAGPAWSSATARGAGAGTTELEMKNGIWTNKVSITLKNSSGAGISGVAANTALYVGTIYMTANGQTGMAFKPTAASGGTANILGVYNAYNRLPVIALSRDTTGGTDYSYNSTTWRAANNNSNNRISWVDGLQQSTVQAINEATVYNSVSTQGSIGTSLDSTSAAPEITASGGFLAAGTSVQTLTAVQPFAPQLGFHYAQRMEVVASGTLNFAGSATSPTRQSNGFTLSLAM